MVARPALRGANKSRRQFNCIFKVGRLSTAGLFVIANISCDSEAREMGMDGVELVMFVEERLGISISDGEAEVIRTPAQLIDLCLGKLRLASKNYCQSQRSFYLLRRGLMKTVGAKRNEIDVDAPIRNYLNGRPEQDFWTSLKSNVAARSWPELSLTHGQEIAGSLSVFFASLCFALTASWPVRTNLDYVAPIFFFVLTSVAIGLARAVKNISMPLRIHIPSKYKTLRDLIPFVATSDEILWTREHVARVVHEAVEYVLTPGDNYREDADFVKDLGLS